MKIGLSLKSNHQIKLRLSKYLIHMVVKEHSSYQDTKNKKYNCVFVRKKYNGRTKLKADCVHARVITHSPHKLLMNYHGLATRHKHKKIAKHQFGGMSANNITLGLKGHSKNIRHTKRLLGFTLQYIKNFREIFNYFGSRLARAPCITRTLR